MNNDTYIHVRACLVVVQDGKILLVPHFDTDGGAIQYNVPGGRVEFGETLEATALREFQEETGYIAECTGFFDIYEHHLPHWHSISIAYQGKIVAGELQAEQSPWGERIPRWFSATEIKEVPHHPAPLITKALAL